MTKPKEKAWASSLAEAKRNATVDMTGPSGTRYTVRIMDLDDLIAEEALPLELVHVALLEKIPGGIVKEIADKLRLGDKETLEQSRELSLNGARLRDRLVLRSVVAPALKPADLEALDPFDKSMIAEIAQRLVVVDAEGKQVGADALAQFRVSGQEQ